MFKSALNFKLINSIIESGTHKLIIDGTLTARQLDNHGPAIIYVPVIHESFDSYYKRS